MARKNGNARKTVTAQTRDAQRFAREAHRAARLALRDPRPTRGGRS